MAGLQSDELYKALKSALKTLRLNSNSRHLHSQTKPVPKKACQCMKPYPTLQCDCCTERFFTKRALEDNTISAPLPGRTEIHAIKSMSLRCNDSDFVNISRKHLEENSNVHDARRKVFETDSISKRHPRFDTADKMFECNYCTHKSTSKGSLILHIRRHTNKGYAKRNNCRPYKCHHCQFESAYKSSLAKHSRKHNVAEKPCISTFCKCKSAGEIAVKRNQENPMKKKRFTCEYCDFKSSPNHLTRHKTKHTGEKPHKCDHCDFKTSQASDLRRHLRVHTGDKPYKCDFCDYKSAQSAHLKRHLKIHTGEKPYKCDFCDYKCAQSSHLINHLRIHTGEKPYKCDYCDYKSICRTHITRHTSNKHSEKKPQKP